MDAGEIVESGSPSEIFENPKEARTQAFLPDTEPLICIKIRVTSGNSSI